MVMRNKVKQLLDSRGITRYQFWKQTGVAQRTAYDLYDNPKQYPSRDVMNKICSTYEVQPGELLEWVPSDGDEEEQSDDSTLVPEATDEPSPAPKRRSRTEPKSAQKQAQFALGSKIKLNGEIGEVVKLNSTNRSLRGCVQVKFGSIKTWVPAGACQPVEKST